MGRMAAWLRQRPPGCSRARLTDDVPRPLAQPQRVTRPARGPAVTQVGPGAPGPAAAAQLPHRAVRPRRRDRLVDREEPPGAPAAVLRPGRGDRGPRAVVRAAAAPGDRGRDRRGHRRVHRGPVRAAVRLRGLAGGRRGDGVDEHRGAARGRGPDDHPVRGAGRDHHDAGRPARRRARALARCRRRRRRRPGGGDRRPGLSPAQAACAGGDRGRRHRRRPARHRPGAGAARRRAGPGHAAAGAGLRARPGRAAVTVRRGGGGRAAVTVPPPAPARRAGHRRPARAAGPGDPQHPGPGPAGQRGHLERGAGAALVRHADLRPGRRHRRDRRRAQGAAAPGGRPRPAGRDRARQRPDRRRRILCSRPR